MSDFETKERRSKSRRRNIMAKMLRDTGEHRGAYALKTVDERKGVYKRERMRVNEIVDEDDD